MSLCDDFHMYFGGTFIGVANNQGTIDPFYVDSVSFDPSIMDLHEVSSSRAFSDEALQALTFSGTRYIAGDSSRTRTIPYGEAILEMPDSKYIKVGNGYRWVTYRSQRSTKKGLCSRRITGTSTMNSEVVYAMFNSVPDDAIVANVFLVKEGVLNYKGVPVGSINPERTEVSLVHEAAHLKRFVEKEFAECQATVLDAEE